MSNTVGLGSTLKVLAPIGIQFPAVQVPDADVNTLDDYEEGTWTPNLQFGGAAVGMTFTSRAGAYVKIGSLVYFTLDVFLLAKGSSTGAAGIPNLPFTNGAFIGSATVGYAANLSSIAGQMLFNIDITSTLINLRQLASGTAANLTEANFTNSSRLIISGCYSV